MKRKLALGLSLVLAFGMSMTAMAAPSPSIQAAPKAQVVFTDAAGTDAAPSNNDVTESTAVSSSSVAVQENTSFTTAGGQVVDPAAVGVVVTTTTAGQAQAAASKIAQALGTRARAMLNMTGRKAISVTDKENRINVACNFNLSLQTANGEAVAHNGSISKSFPLAQVLGGKTLNEGETLQAAYERADGTIVMLPVVIKNGCVAIAIPAFAGTINITFLITKGESLEDIPVKTSPNT